MTEQSKIAITGGNGVVGTALTSQLEGKYDVISIDRPIDIIANPEEFQRALAGADTVVHLAGVFGLKKDGKENWRSPHRDPVNTKLFNTALRGAIESEATQFIHASSIHVEDTMEFSARNSGLLAPQPRVFATETKSGYGQGKREQELWLEEHAGRFERGAVSIRLGGVTPDNAPMKEHGDPSVLAHEQRVWLEHGDLADLVGRIIEFEDNAASHDVVYAVSDNDRRFHDTKNQYGWTPTANSSEHIPKQ